MTDNKWETFASTFEENNNYVVGLSDIQAVKDSLSSFSNLGNTLELGCGNGTYTTCLLNSASKITATDLSEDMVAVTSERFKATHKVNAEQADCFNLKYADSTFDTVFMANLIHVVPNPDALLDECLRVLKKGGRLIAVSFTLHGMTLLNRLKLKYRYVKTYGKKSSNNFVLTPEIAINLCKEAGYENIQSKVIGKHVKAVMFTADKPC